MSGQVDFQAVDRIRKRVRLCDYLSVAELFLQDNFLLERDLKFDDIKPRLLGHWGTCHGINVAYANLKNHFAGDRNFSFILGPGHGFPALQANLWLDGELGKIDRRASRDTDGIAYLCREFSWPDGFPSHASPLTPGVITEGGELGYALANAYGMALGHPEKTIAVLIGDGELETATALASLNLRDLLSSPSNGTVLPILHLNGYKISAPSVYARKSERELNELIRGFGFTPFEIDGENPEEFQNILNETENSSCVNAVNLISADNMAYEDKPTPFYILKTEKGYGGPNRHHEAHQIPLKNPKTNEKELKELEKWLKSYHFEELFDRKEGILV